VAGALSPVWSTQGDGCHNRPASYNIFVQCYWQTCKRRSQIPLNLTLTIALTLLTLMVTVSGNPNLLTLLTLLLSTVVNWTCVV